MKISSLVVLSLFTAALMLAPIAGEAAQQNKMKACSEQANAKGLGEGKGEERKAFMKECLSAKTAPAKNKTAQQDKMRACNKEAGEKQLKSDERKQFMSTCLSS
jgi:psiF repeat